MNTIEKKVKSIFSRLMDNDALKKASIFDDLIDLELIDFDHFLEIISDLEEEFKLKFYYEDVISSNINSIHGITQYIQAKQGQAKAA